MEKANLTLYTVIGDPGRIPATIEKLFQGVAKSFTTEDNQSILVLQDDTRMIFNLSHVQNKAEFIEMHTSGMAAYFAQAPIRNEQLHQNVLLQIRSFNCVMGIVFEIDDNNNRTNYLTNTLFDLAESVNGLLLYPNMHLYNGKGKLIFSIEGESELETFVPIANSDLLEINRPSSSPADEQRKAHSLSVLKTQKVPYIEHLPNEIFEQEVILKSREEMIKRATALFAVAVYSEVLLSENPDREEALTYFNKMDEIYGIHAWLSPAERAYMMNPQPEETERIQFVWRYECCAVLLWAAGIVEELPYPSEICDVPVIAGLFWQHQGIEDLLSKGIPRTEAEILDAADLHFRYDWACVEARTHNQEAPATLDGGIVMERHYAFNWIIGANQNAEWDHIQPAT